MSEQEIKDRINYFYLKIDGTYDFPNSKEGDLLKMVHKVLANEDSSLELAVKALEWYGDDKNQKNQRMYAGYESEVMKDAGKIAQSTLSQIRGEKT